MKNLLARLLSAVVALAALSTAKAAAPTLSFSQGSIARDAVGTIVYNIGTIASGETVMIERFYDVNANGAIDAGEPLIRRFTVTDGSAPSIGGVRNKNVPGDDDGAANGAIRAEIPFPGADPGAERMDGRFVTRVTAAGGTALATFQVTQPTLPQRVSGTVMNGSNNAPIPYAVVVIVPPDAPGIYATTVANGVGAFSVTLPPGPWEFFASSGGFIASGENAGVSLGAGQNVTHNVAMIPAANRVLGRLTDSATGAGVGSVIISAQSESASGFLIAIDLTDANGNFRLPVNAGNWQVKPLEQSLQAVGYLRNEASVTVAGADVTQNLALTRANTLIYGNVRRSTGEALPDIAMWAQLANQDGDEIQSRSNAAGEYFVAAGPGMWEVGAEGSSLTPLRLRAYSQTVTVAANESARLDFSFQGTTAVFAGRVVDQFGAAIPGVFFHGHFGEDGNSVGAGSTGPNGEFEIAVWGGQWRFHVGDDLEGTGLIESDMHVTIVDGVDQRNVVYTVLRTNFRINGTVRTQAGQPVVGVQVHASATINGKEYQSTGDTDATGAYSLPVTAGNWTVFVDCFDLQQQNYSCPSSVTRSVQDGNQGANFTVNAPTVDAHLRGRAVDQAGNPISGLTIGAYGNGPQRQATTDQNGNFDIGVSAGWWTLEISGTPPPGTISPSIANQVQQGVDINNINFRVLNAPYTISGVVRNGAGAAQSDLFVFTQSMVGDVNYLARVQTDENGAYALPVFNGEWSMWMDCSGVEARGYDCPQLSSVTIQGAGVSRDIVLTTPAAHLRGFVRDETGAAISFSGLQVTAGGETRYFSSNNDGSFSIGVPAGPVELKSSNPNGNYITPTLNFTVTQGVDINNIDFRMLDYDRQLTGSLRSSQNAPLWGVDFYATATINGLNYRIGNFDTTDQSGYVSVRAAYGTWTLHFDCDAIMQRGYVCPSPLPTYTLTANSADFAVTVSPPVVEGATISNLQYTGGASPTFRFRVTGAPGTYDIVRSDSLLNGSWGNVGTSVTISPGGTFQDVILPVTGTRGFFGAVRR